uniref:Protochlorophyllide reductase n=1 Tax=Zooxanthella nutricula TaxID=1333877 RepID=A0A6U6XTE8_9DINO
MSRCWALVTNEASGYMKFGQLVWQMLRCPNVYTKMTFTQFMRGTFGLLHEAITNKGLTCEQVAEAACGKGNFHALEGQVAIITGASNGLGLENARVLMKYGCHVIWAVRNPAKAEQALKTLEAAEGKFSGKATILKVDISDLTTVKPFVTAFLKLGLPLHKLILNAGIMAPLQWEASAQGYESMFATNNLGHFLMTELLLPKLDETAKTSQVRIVILSSMGASMCDGIDISKVPVPKEEYHELADYNVTKAFDSFHARGLQKKYAGTNIFATCVHPGLIGTGLLDRNPGLGQLFYTSVTFAPFRKSVLTGSATTMYCALGPEIPEQVKQGFFFYYNCRPQYSSGISKPGVADHLVDAAEQLQLKLVKPFM